MKTLKFNKYCEDSSQLVESSSKYYILDVTIVLSIYKLRTFSCVEPMYSILAANEMLIFTT